MACGIYQWVNRINRKRYIGSSEDIQSRRRHHLNALLRGTHDNEHFQRAWNEYGADQFSFEILRECEPDDLLMWEQVYVDCYDPADLYNINLEVDRPPSCSKEARQKISKAKTGRVVTEETRRKLSEAGRNISEETRRNKSEAQRGRIHTEETRRKLSEVARNRSDETRRNMSEVRKGKVATEETRRKMSEAHKNMSNETRRKMSEAAKRRKNKIHNNIKE